MGWQITKATDLVAPPSFTGEQFFAKTGASMKKFPLMQVQLLQKKFYFLKVQSLFLDMKKDKDVALRSIW